VIEIVEDIDDYRGFEAAVIADYDARTAVERELVLRLASLLWRLRRASAIETDLLRIQAEILLDRAQSQAPGSSPVREADPFGHAHDNGENSERWRANRFFGGEASPSEPIAVNSARQLTLCFQRLANLDNGVFERLGRYEGAIARQVLKTLYLLQSVRVR
jgi:hypothetical protein